MKTQLLFYILLSFYHFGTCRGNCNKQSPFLHFNPYENKCTNKIGELVVNVFEREMKCPEWTFLYTPGFPANYQDTRKDRMCLCSSSETLVLDNLFKCDGKYTEKCGRYPAADCGDFHGKTDCTDPLDPQTCKCPVNSIWNSTADFCFSNRNCQYFWEANPSEYGLPTYDSNRNACVGLVGQICEPSSLKLICPENAECQPTYDWDRGGEKITFNRCKCKEGFYEGKDKRSCNPQLGFGESCDNLMNPPSYEAGPICKGPLRCNFKVPSTCSCQGQDTWDEILQACVKIN